MFPSANDASNELCEKLVSCHMNPQPVMVDIIMSQTVTHSVYCEVHGVKVLCLILDKSKISVKLFR